MYIYIYMYIYVYICMYICLCVWKTSWSTQRWITTYHPGSWIASPTNHSMWGHVTVSRKRWSAVRWPHKEQCWFPFSATSTLQTLYKWFPQGLKKSQSLNLTISVLPLFCFWEMCWWDSQSALHVLLLKYQECQWHFANSLVTSPVPERLQQWILLQL